MGALTSARGLLARHGLRPKKSWGQNFLVDETVQTGIVKAAGLSREDVVVEIGAGLGAITRRLAEAAGRVIAIERDSELAAVLTAELAALGNVEVVRADALEFDFRGAAAAAGRPLVVVGNLPYQITTPLVFGICGAANRGLSIARAVLMVQREFAERMKAPRGSKTYGRLSVMVQQQAEVDVLFHVGSSSFFPPPAVTSSVLRLAPRREPRAPVRDEMLFQTVVRAAFGTRRKMLRRALAASFDQGALAAAFAAAGIEGTRRAEELAIEDFARLADALTAAGARATSVRVTDNA